jgi:molybdenum cofactor cytidylyltransferase
MNDVAAVLLAAGSGRRFTAAGGSGSKLLAELDGRPLLLHALDAIVAAGLAPVVVVLPPDSAELLAAIDGRGDVDAVVNPEAADGLATSVAVGLRTLAAAHPGSDEGGPIACLILLADQPALDADVLERVIDTWRRTGRPVRVRYDDGPGHPVLLPRPVWETIEGRLVTLDEHGRERGAGRLLAELEVIDIPVPGPAPVDVDVPGDLVRAAAEVEGRTRRAVRATEDVT